MALHVQVIWLFVLAIPIASVAWTFTHEEIFREMREYCEHWITLVFVLLTGYRLLLEDWRGVLIAVFALVWVANVYMSVYGRLRLGIKAEHKEIAIKEEVLAHRR